MKEPTYTTSQVMEIITEGLKTNNKNFGLKERLYNSDYTILGAVDMAFKLHKTKYNGHNNLQEKTIP